jgi:hypothetical protein
LTRGGERKGKMSAHDRLMARLGAAKGAQHEHQGTGLP